VYHGYGGKRSMHSSIEQMARIIWLGRYTRENFMGLFYAAYFDASGENEGFPILSVAGAVAPVSKWVRFERQWNQALADEGVTEYHASQFHSNHGEFRDWKGDVSRRAKFLDRLKQIIRDNTNKHFSTSVEIAAWDSVNKEFCLKEAFHSPYALACFGVIDETRKWGQRKGVSSSLEYIFQEGDKGWGGLLKLCAPHGIAPIRLPTKKAIPFQVGDLLAWKSRTVATNALRILEDTERNPTEKEKNSKELLKELGSHNDVFVRPAFKGIFSYRALVQTCINHKVPRR